MKTFTYQRGPDGKLERVETEPPTRSGDWPSGDCRWLSAHERTLTIVGLSRSHEKSFKRLGRYAREK